MAESVIKLPTGSSEQASLRQPPTVPDTTAAAFLRSTHNAYAIFYTKHRLALISVTQMATDGLLLCAVPQLFSSSCKSTVVRYRNCKSSHDTMSCLRQDSSIYLLINYRPLSGPSRALCPLSVCLSARLPPAVFANEITFDLDICVVVYLDSLFL